jgi:hypothetical protein
MKNILIAVTTILITGCSVIPSFYDDNESMLASNIVHSVELVDCGDTNPSFIVVGLRKEQLKTYSTLKGSEDILNLIEIFEKSLNPVLKKDTMSTKYCELKKETLHKQSSSMTRAIMGRFQ